MDPVELELSDQLKGYGFKRLAFVGRKTLRVEYHDTPIVTSFDFDDYTPSMKRLRKEAEKRVTSNGVAAEKIVDDLMLFVTKVTADYYEANGNGVVSIKEQHQSSNGNNRHAVMKYTSHVSDFAKLWETVRIGDKFHFVSYDPLQMKLSTTNEITENGKTIVPFTEEAIEHYAFESMDEQEQHIQLAKKETAGSLFKKIRRWAAKFYDTDIPEYIDLIAGDIFFTYFQDRIGKTHYLFVWGDPDQGKGAILETFNQLGYRGVQITDATAATVYRILGSVEKGQAILIIDEANQLENDTFLLNVLKVGYKGNTKIPRVMDAQSSENNRVEYFYPYGFKIIAAEHLPDRWKTGGFQSRCFKIKTAPGDPDIDIGDVVDNAGDPTNAAILAQLTKLRKTLFAYRLLHYHEPIPDIKLKGITGRDRELTKPLIRLFGTHGDSESLETIKSTMHYFIKERNADKSESLNAEVLKRVKELINFDSENTTNELEYKTIWDDLKLQLNGKDVEDKRDTMDTDLFGQISSKRLAGVLRSIGGNKAKNSAGDKRVWKFDDKTLARYSRIYKEIPDTIELEEGGEEEKDTNDDNDEEEDEEYYNNDIDLDSSDTSDTSDTSNEKVGGF